MLLTARTWNNATIIHIHSIAFISEVPVRRCYLPLPGLDATVKAHLLTPAHFITITLTPPLLNLQGQELHGLQANSGPSLKMQCEGVIFMTMAMILDSCIHFFFVTKIHLPNK